MIRNTNKMITRKRPQFLMIILALTVGMAVIGPVKAALWDSDLSIKAIINTGHMTRSGDVVFSKVVQQGNTGGQGWGSFSSSIEPLNGLTAHKINLDIQGVKKSGNFVIESKILNQGSTIPVCFINGKPELIENANPGILEVEYQLTNPKAMVGGGGLDAGDEENGLIRIRVQNDTIPGTYSFRILIPCVQYNAPDEYPVAPGLWSDTLEIHGSVQIVPEAGKEKGGNE